ncbi:MAG: Lrp/AsnC family transcriptional regulator [Bernardetiaceae bacterium]
MKLDPIDRKILDILQHRAKITNAQLSKEVNLSPAPTLERVKKLEMQGFIESYHAKLNAQRLGLGVTTYVSIKLNRHNKETNQAFEEKVNQIDEIIECYFTTGTSDYLLKVVTADIDSYQRFIMEKISKIKEIDHIQTMVVLSTLKDTRVLPITETSTKE